MVLWLLHRVLSVQRELTPIKNFECCAVLGKGAFGKVFLITDLGQQAGATSLVQVIMSVQKAVNLCGLMACTTRSLHCDLRVLSSVHTHTLPSSTMLITQLLMFAFGCNVVACRTYIIV